MRGCAISNTSICPKGGRCLGQDTRRIIRGILFYQLWQQLKEGKKCVNKSTATKLMWCTTMEPFQTNAIDIVGFHSFEFASEWTRGRFVRNDRLKSIILPWYKIIVLMHCYNGSNCIRRWFWFFFSFQFKSFSCFFFCSLFSRNSNNLPDEWQPVVRISSVGSNPELCIRKWFR